MRYALAVVLAALASPVAAAQDIYKCTTGGGVAYQSVPCAAGESQTRLFVGPMIPRSEAVTAPAPLARPPEAPRRAGPWRQRTLAPGMSDDEVLNMPGWGRPAHIVRTRVGREWQEVWTYASGGAGEHELRFVNARLAEIVEARPRVAQLTWQ